jgi:hypothetical protein
MHFIIYVLAANQHFLGADELFEYGPLALAGEPGDWHG